MCSMHVHVCACVCVCVFKREKNTLEGVRGIRLDQDAILVHSSKKAACLHRLPSLGHLQSFIRVRETSRFGK